MKELSYDRMEGGRKGERASHYIHVYWCIDNEITYAGFTGIDSSYEPPENPDLVLKASEYTVQECVDKLVGFLQERVLYKISIQ